MAGQMWTLSGGAGLGRWAKARREGADRNAEGEHHSVVSSARKIMIGPTVPTRSFPGGAAGSLNTDGDELYRFGLDHDLLWDLKAELPLRGPKRGHGRRQE